VGAIRIATSMERTHLALHAPQGDTYADLLFTMIERRPTRPKVSYSTFQARDLGGDTAGIAQATVREAYERFQPDLLLVGESCTAELIQDQPGTLAQGMGLPVPIVPLDLPAYSKKENWGASETFYRIVRTLLAPIAANPQPRPSRSGRAPRANVLGPTSLGFRCRDDIVEVRRLLESVGVEVGVVAPDGASPADLQRIPEADFNVCLYPEIARTTCKWLEKTFDQPTVETVPIGVGATRDFLREVAALADLEAPAFDEDSSRLPWYSRSVDSTYLTGKRVFIFGDATHAIAAARIAKEELGFSVVGLGTYSRESAREVREAAGAHGIEALITDDYLEVEARVAELQPELVLGTQMERNIAKRLGIPCAVISSPVHVQDFPARYSPQMGFEGANVIFDSWIHPLMMGLEEHLLNMFRDDFEFNDSAAPSHLAAEGSNRIEEATASRDADGASEWEPAAHSELQKVPFFVRGKARRNTERFAAERGIRTITIETLYEAKSHYAR
jgi:light-independent protochlorophyllide reductase subunit B